MFSFTKAKGTLGRTSGVVLLCVSALTISVGSASATPVLSSTPEGVDISRAISGAPAELRKPLDSIFKNVEYFHSSYRAVEGQEFSEAVQRSYNSLTSGTVELHLPTGAHFNGDDARVFQSKDNSLVFVPTVGGGLISPSGVTISFDSSMNVIDYVEQHFASLGADRGRVTSWVSGAIKVDKIAHSDGSLTDPSSAASPERPVAMGFGDFLGYLNDCLASAGIASWLVAALASACAIACAGTLGWGCLPCIYAVAGGTGGTIGWCIGVAAERAGF